MKPSKFIFQTNDTHKKSFDSPPTPTKIIYLLKLILLLVINTHKIVVKTHH